MTQDVSRYLLGKMVSKEATEAVIKEATLSFVLWLWSENLHHQVINYAGKNDAGLCVYTVNIADENFSMTDLAHRPKYTLSQLFDYYFDNIFKKP